MAEGSYCPSDFFCPSIAEFIDKAVYENTKGIAGEFDKLFASVPLELLQDDTATPTAPPPTSSTLCLPGPSNAHELQRLKDKNRNKNTDKSTNNWARRFDTWQQHRGITVPVSNKTSAGDLDEILQHFFTKLYTLSLASFPGRLPVARASHS